VKEDVVYIAGPVRYQVWHGWPTDDDSVIAALFSGCWNATNNCSVTTAVWIKFHVNIIASFCYILMKWQMIKIT